MKNYYYEEDDNKEIEVNNFEIFDGSISLGGGNYKIVAPSLDDYDGNIDEDLYY